MLVAEGLDAALIVVDSVPVTKVADVAVPMAVHRCVLFVCLFGRRSLDRGWCS